MLLPSNLQTGRVEWRAVADIIDSDDPDTEPDIIPAQGEVWFDAEVSYWPSGTADSGPMTIVHVQKVAIIDGDGFLCSPDPRDPSKPGPNRFIRLFATNDPDYGVTGWKWRATPRLKDVNGKALRDAVPSKEFFLDAGTTLDLTHVFNKPLVGGPSTPLLQLEGAAGAAAGSARKAELSAAAAELEAGDAKESVYRAEAAVVGALSRVGADDAQVAGHIKDGTQTKAVVEGLVLRENQETVPPLVAQALAADRTVADAATVAVSSAAAGLELLEALRIEDPEAVFSVTDALGRRSWIEVGLNGGPTEHSASFFRPLIEAIASAALSSSAKVLSNLPVESDLSFSIVDSAGRRSWIESGLDGKPTSNTVQLLRTALALPEVVEEQLPEAQKRYLEVSGESPNRKVWVNTAGQRRLVAGNGDAHTPRFSDDERAIFYSTALGDKFRPADLSGPEGRALPLKVVVGTGDSLTAAGSFLSRIGAVLGVPTINMGVAGWSSADIATRQGGLQPALTLAGNAIPASGPVTVTARNPADGWRTGTSTIFRWNGTLAGVPGLLEHDHPGGNIMRFTRTTSGEAVPCPPGTRFVGTDGEENRDKIHLVFSGRNNVNAAQVVRDEKSIVEHLTPYLKEFLIVSVINGQTETKGTTGYKNVLAVNDGKKSAFPSHYYDLRSEFITKGLSLAGLVATVADAAAIANDAPPPTLMADNVHPNSVGYRVIGDLFAAEITKRGWLA